MTTNTPPALTLDALALLDARGLWNAIAEVPHHMEPELHDLLIEAEENADESRDESDRPLAPRSDAWFAVVLASFWELADARGM